jgi:Ca2+-binding EF-hand superfamily protein
MGNDEHLHKAFAFFDRNQSGFIEIEELRDALNDEPDANSEEVINAIMHDVDTDKVSVEAFFFKESFCWDELFFLTFKVSKGHTI